MAGVRIDKWLWACRFYKTRAKAKEAIDGGKVHLNGARTKPSKELNIDDQLKFTQGFDEKVVRVVALSERRQAAPIAQTLYEESVESIAKRTLVAEQRRALGTQQITDGRPTKKDRRLIHKFRDNNL
jgi:ribosome-associated heat shock protein Hsp15